MFLNIPAARCMSFSSRFLLSFLQTNPFDLFETFFGASMGSFSGMDQSAFRTRRRGAAVKGEDIR